MTSRIWLRVCAAAAAVLLPLGATSQARAGEAYYLLMFASQTIPNEPDYSHTYATFVRATWPGDCPPKAPITLETVTISWLPQELPVRTYKLRPECGRNYGLHETIQYALANNCRVSLWGPFQIEPELYYRAVKQYGVLNSGQVRYKAIDTGYRTDHVSNCIHAVTSVRTGYRVRVLSSWFGETASFIVLKELEPWVLDRCTTHPWVGTALGLDNYPIIYREWEAPKSGAFFGPIYRALGGERNLAPSYGPPVR